MEQGDVSLVERLLEVIGRYGRVTTGVGRRFEVGFAFRASIGDIG